MKGVVQERPAGAAYTSIAGALLPFDPESGQITGAAVSLGEARPADKKSEAVAENLHRNAPQPPPPVAVQRERVTEQKRAFGPREVVRAAKARIKDIKAQLREHEALKKELAELERLVAASRKPVAPVRELRRSG